MQADESYRIMDKDSSLHKYRSLYRTYKTLRFFKDFYYVIQFLFEECPINIVPYLDCDLNN